MHARKPNLLEVFRPRPCRRLFGYPEVAPKESTPLIDRDRVASDSDVRILGRVRESERVFVPADGTHRIPDANKPRLAAAPGKGAFEILGQLEIPLLLDRRRSSLALDFADRH